ncbi:hypothetical protein, partial [Collinsella aerofaciens]|uniref:hypothetical protein n=1 Tax=Collinsella aerofaciens TaxID=74426 RepID=UPI001E3567AC
IMLHPQINAHKESLPFLMSKKWEAVQLVTGFTFQMVPPQRDIRVRLAPPASASSLRSLRAALENACVFPQLRTLSGSNPGISVAKSPSPRG